MWYPKVLWHHVVFLLLGLWYLGYLWYPAVLLFIFKWYLGNPVVFLFLVLRNFWCSVDFLFLFLFMILRYLWNPVVFTFMFSKQKFVFVHFSTDTTFNIVDNVHNSNMVPQKC